MTHYFDQHIQQNKEILKLTNNLRNIEWIVIIEALAVVGAAALALLPADAKFPDVQP